MIIININFVESEIMFSKISHKGIEYIDRIY